MHATLANAVPNKGRTAARTARRTLGGWPHQHNVHSPSLTGTRQRRQAAMRSMDDNDGSPVAEPPSGSKPSPSSSSSHDAAPLGNNGNGSAAPLNSTWAPTTFDETDETSGSNVLLSRQNATKELIAYVLAAVIFGVGVAVVSGGEASQEYFAGYLLEQSLSVDNLLVFVLIFRYFKLPMFLQKRVLNYGLWGAAIARLVMIVAGVEAIEAFEPLLLVFAAILLYSSYKILAEQEEEAEEEDGLQNNEIVRFCRKLYLFTPTYEGERFFSSTTVVDPANSSTPWTARALSNILGPARSGEPLFAATPLLLVLLVVELSDIVFAVDSIPAVFGITRDPIIVYSSNMFAICCLRSLFQLVSEGLEEMKYLQTSIGSVLGFVGLKMVAEYFGAEVETSTSLAIIGGTLTVGVVASYLVKDDDN